MLGRATFQKSREALKYVNYIDSKILWRQIDSLVGESLLIHPALCVYSRAVATGTAGRGMAVPFFDNATNKFECILSL